MCGVIDNTKKELTYIRFARDVSLRKLRKQTENDSEGITFEDRRYRSVYAQACTHTASLQKSRNEFKIN